MSVTKTIAKGSAWMLIAAFLIKFFGWIYYVVLARTVSQEQIGVFYIVLSVINIVIIFSNLGLGSGAVKRYVAFYAGEGKFNYVKKILKISSTAGIIFSIICMILIMMVSPKLADFFHNPGLVPIFYIMAVHILVWNFYSMTIGFLQARKKIRLISHMKSLQGSSKLIFTVILLFFLGFTVKSIAFGFVLSFIFTSLVGLRWAFKEYRSLPESDEYVGKLELLKDMLPFGLTTVLISSVSIINNSTDRLMLGYFLPAETGAAMVGIYTITIGFASVMLIFTSAIGVTIFPIITESWARKDIKGIADVTSIFIRWAAITTTPLLLGILIFSRQILTIIYGSDYALGYIALMLYGAGLFVYVFSLPIQYTLTAMRRLDVTLKIVAVSAALNVILNFILIPRYGIEGAALTSAISFTVMTMLFFYIKEITYLKIPRDIYKMILAGIITIIPLIVFKPFIGGVLGSVPTLIVSNDIIMEVLKKFLKLSVLGILILIAGIIYLAFLILFRVFVKEDVDIISGAMRRLYIPKKWILVTERILLRK